MMTLLDATGKGLQGIGCLSPLPCCELEVGLQSEHRLARVFTQAHIDPRVGRKPLIAQTPELIACPMGVIQNQHHSSGLILCNPAKRYTLVSGRNPWNRGLAMGPQIPTTGIGP